MMGHRAQGTLIGQEQKDGEKIGSAFLIFWLSATSSSSKLTIRASVPSSNFSSDGKDIS